MPLFAIMECRSMTQSCSTFAIKYFWQIVNMICNFAKLIVVDPCILCSCSCHGQLNKHAILLQVCLFCHALLCDECIKPTKIFHNTVSAMLCFLPGLIPVNENCYLQMGAIISSGPFWLMVSKGLLFYAFSSIMSCLCLT